MIPNFLKKSFIRTGKRHLRSQRAEKERSIPKVNFQNRHIDRTQLLVDRNALLNALPKKGVVAELGVDQGEFTSSILEINQPKKLHLVDTWANARYNENKKTTVEEKFEKEVDSGQLEINIGKSLDVVSQFPDQYFNWIYIDTTHSYEMTLAELEAYQPKMLPGGIMSGHDYVKWNESGFTRYGVIEAVSKFCNDHDWEVIYITTEVDFNPSFAIRKIG